MRFYVIDKNYQATETDAGNAARRFTARFAIAAIPWQAGAVPTWLRRSADADGRDAL